MVNTNIGVAQAGDQASTFQDYSVDPATTDAPTGDETKWTNPKAAQYLGYYKLVPQLKKAINAKATWTIGKGFKSNPLTTLALSIIKGCGVDTFNTILENLVKMYHIYGDAFAEIVRDDTGRLINLKPLDPSVMTIVADGKGIIKRYELQKKGKKMVPFEPDRILHLARDRIADEIHGTSIVESVEWIILALEEAMHDNRKRFHRNIYPVRVWYLDTDKDAKINAYKQKVADSKYKGEDMFVPKGSVETELTAVPENSSLNPIPWIQMLESKFYKEVGVPEIITGGSQELTQTAAQIAYLAFEQVVEEEQLYVEEQVLQQLDLEIELEFPASLQNNMLSDDAKDGTQEQQVNQASNLQPPAMREGVQ